ncbi:MAG: N-acetyltransferase [Parasphingorhabdus sp.]|uniref:GNAT family N-acetyltransferase n=1 Tax=Parasphingorhabdus sp. TaxID=2709688 RepID=UPI00329A08D0
MEFRDEKPADQAAIFAVTKAAFETDAEARLIDMLRDDGDLYFSHIGQNETGIVSHIALSPMDVVGNGNPIKALGLGPVAVEPELQGHGIGSQMVNFAIQWATENHWQLIILLGSPQYYSRFGFSAKDAEPFASPFAGQYFQALWLDANVQKPQSGRAEYASAFGRL